MNNKIPYHFDVRKVNKKHTVVRVWHDGWFPVTPIKDLDFKIKGQSQ